MLGAGDIGEEGMKGAGGLQAARHDESWVWAARHAGSWGALGSTV